MSKPNANVIGSSQPAKSGLSDQTIFEVALFLIPFLAAFELKFMGRMLFSDLVIVPFAAAALIVRGLPKNRLVLFTLILAMLWFATLIISDIVNQSTPENYLRGWARDGLACVYLLFFFSAVEPTVRSFTIVAAAMAFAMAAQPLMLHRIDFEWFVKFGGGAAANLVLCIITMRAWRNGRTFAPLVCFILFMILALVTNVRSSLSISLVIAGLISMAFYGHSHFRRASVPLILTLVLAIGGTAGLGLAKGYGYLAASGALGKAAQGKYEAQSHNKGNVLATIWNARPEMRVAVAVITDSPLLGHGSWYHDPKIAAAELLFSGFASPDAVGDRSSVGIATQVLRDQGGQAMGHSTILQAWVEGGIVGAAFWLWIIFLSIWAIIQSLRYPVALTPVLFWAAAGLCWDIIFSPFGNMSRMGSMLQITVVILSLTQTQLSRARALQIDPAGFGR